MAGGLEIKNTKVNFLGSSPGSFLCDVLARWLLRSHISLPLLCLMCVCSWVSAQGLLIEGQTLLTGSFSITVIFLDQRTWAHKGEFFLLSVLDRSEFGLFECGSSLRHLELIVSLKLL
jgi:hypothetical protein